MANTFSAAPAALSEIILPGLKGRLAFLSAFSTNLSTNAVGKTIQVSLVSGGAAKEFSKANGGYKEGDNADLTAVSVTLKHLHSTKEFTPDEIGEYGEEYLARAFVPEAINQLVKKVHAEIGAVLTNANFSAKEVVTAANFNYSQVVDLNTDLNDAKAGDPRCLLVMVLCSCEDAPNKTGSFSQSAQTAQPGCKVSRFGCHPLLLHLAYLFPLYAFRFSHRPAH